MRCAKILAGLMLVLLGLQHGAVANTLQHEPPKVKAGEPVTLTLPLSGIKRARAWVAAASGIKLVDFAPCRSATDTLCASLPAPELAILKYFIQAETIDGNYERTPYLSLRQPSNAEVEQRVAALTLESNELQEQLVQLEAKLTSVKALTPQLLQLRKGQESAKAYLVLNRRERELTELRALAAEREEALRAQRMQSERGRTVEALQREMEDEARQLRWETPK